MAYRITADDVAADVAQFTAPARYYWDRSPSLIAADPHEREATSLERAISIASVPLMEFSYKISRHEYVSGEVVYVFSADFFPRRAIAYVIDEWDNSIDGSDGEVRVIYVRYHD